MLYFMLSASMILSIIFLFLNHPLSMGLILFLQAICMCLISGFMSVSFWFSYILLLIYLGGMLVLFMYVTSLASNEMFLYSNKIFLTILFFPIIFIFMYYINLNFPLNLYENMENSFIMNFTSNNFLLKMYNQPINMITILIASYLFLTLIVVVKIINVHKGPLRQMN
uniref:NADH-ubiquinone oxidoreductase chain 6 n=1 Tax=Statilia maculata TaxID=64626 RepID=A0A343C6H9_9NEOP|nr:NADH dehydrogenase subunit 6 [Statilia maculata]ARJ54748.1 NADH dehydrogenase subunit 6 [Statilia maculata]ASY98155.1 NADH dehydrogenase subunit 6 [Statilia maculata]UUF67538.1 NADH dehydrogenase subunit 6 [Statilia maculata]